MVKGSFLVRGCGQALLADHVLQHDLGFGMIKVAGLEKLPKLLSGIKVKQSFATNKKTSGLYGRQRYLAREVAGWVNLGCGGAHEPALEDLAAKNLFLHGASGDEPIHRDLLRLADAVRTVDCLSVGARVPAWVDNNDPVRARQRDSHAAHLKKGRERERKKERERERKEQKRGMKTDDEQKEHLSMESTLILPTWVVSMQRKMDGSLLNWSMSS